MLRHIRTTINQFKITLMGQHKLNDSAVVLFLTFIAIFLTLVIKLDNINLIIPEEQILLSLMVSLTAFLSRLIIIQVRSLNHAKPIYCIAVSVPWANKRSNRHEKVHHS